MESQKAPREINTSRAEPPAASWGITASLGLLGDYRQSSQRPSLLGVRGKKRLSVFSVGCSSFTLRSYSLSLPLLLSHRKG